MSASDLLRNLADQGGSIVRANDCSNEEIEIAMTNHRFGTDEYGNSFVHRPQNPHHGRKYETSPAHMPS